MLRKSGKRDTQLGRTPRPHPRPAYPGREGHTHTHLAATPAAMDVTNLSRDSLRALLISVFSQDPTLFQEVLSASQPSAEPICKPAQPRAPAPQAPTVRETVESACDQVLKTSVPIPDFPDSPDSSPAHPSPVDDDMEIDLGARAQIESSASSSSDSEGYTLVQGGKRKKKSSSSKKASSAPPAKTATPPAAARPATPVSPTPAVSVTAKKERPPPPLFLREKEKWDNVSSLLRERKIPFTSARSTKDGIKVQLTSSADHRKLTALLRLEKIGYHTYALEDERLLRVVIRGLPAEHNTDTIKADLQAQNFPVREVHRMYSGRTKVPYDLVLVILNHSPEGKAIFGLKSVNGLSGLRVETPFRNGNPSQCHRCQLYGHSAKNCYARARCVKCLGDHGTAECTRTKGTSVPPSCVLCRAEGHTANYRGCPMAPKVTNKRVAKRFPDRIPQPLPQYTKAAPKLAMVPQRAPLPTVSAWAKALPFTSLAHQAKPSAPSRHPQGPPPAPSGPYKAPSGPSKMSQSDLAADLAFITSFNLPQIRVLARELREAKSAVERVFLLEANSALIEALSSPPQRY